MTITAEATPIRKRFRAMRLLTPALSLLPLRLETLLRLSGSDKEYPDADRGHHYGAAYQRHFGPLKYRRVKLLEIGVGGFADLAGGESLAAWSCYFPFGEVVGCDIEDKRHLTGGRIRVHQIDQSCADDLDRIAIEEGPFDIVIDDGSHVNAHQILTFERLFPHVKAGGIYVVEDVLTSYSSGFGGKPVNEQDRATCMGLFTELALYLNHREFLPEEGGDPEMLRMAEEIASIYFEHNLIILRKARGSPS